MQKNAKKCKKSVKKAQKEQKIILKLEKWYKNW